MGPDEARHFTARLRDHLPMLPRLLTHRGR
jgi:hypothetical protein